MTATAASKPSFRVPVVGIVIVALVLFAGYRLAYAPPDAPPLGRVWGTGYPQSSNEAVAHFREAGSVAERRAGETPDDWLSWQDAAAAWLSVARLTGNPADFARAEAALEKAFAIASPGAGPHHILSAFEFAVHRLSKAQTAIDATDRYAVPDADEVRGDGVGIKGDIALYRGDYGHALGHYEVAEKLAGPIIACRAANLYAWLGRTTEALTALARCEAGPKMRTPQFAAGVDLQRGIIQLQRGRLDEAEEAFERANRTFPGYWRIGMRLAQIKALRGDITGGIGAFEAIADRTGNPEPMDILAGLYRAQGDGARSRAWAARAAAGWQVRLAAFPETAWAHVAEHELAFGDPRRALGYAARNARNRPYAESLLILAKAWMANGRADYAVALADKVNRSGWQSVEQHIVAADALALTGKGEEAKAERAIAEKLNPEARARNPAFAWLDH